MKPTYMISAGAYYHYVHSIYASSTGAGVLKLTLKGDPKASQYQFNDAEITIFTDNIEVTERLIAAINGASRSLKITKQRIGSVETAARVFATLNETGG